MKKRNNKKKKNKRFIDVNQDTKRTITTSNQDSSSDNTLAMVDSSIIINDPNEDSTHISDEINHLESVEGIGTFDQDEIEKIVDNDVKEIEKIVDNDVKEDSLDYEEYVKQHAAENEDEDDDHDGDDNNDDDIDDAIQDEVDSVDGIIKESLKNDDEDDGDGRSSSMNEVVVDADDEQVLDIDEVNESNEAIQLAKTLLSIIELDTISTYCHSGDSIVALCKACLQLDDPVLYTQVTNHENRLFYNSVFDSDDKSNYSRTIGKSDCHPLSHPAIDKHNSSINIDQQLLTMVDNGTVSFLADLLIKPRRAINKHDLSWLSWTNIIELICQALKHDFDTLMNWR